MEEFTEILQSATAQIAPEYFHLPIDGSDPVYRERVYCYELYHQMRLRWPKGCEYFLNGEVDKSGHRYFREQGSPKPDFIIHIPGTDDNYAVMEVKAANPSPKAVQKDVETLIRFRDLGYTRALYLIYGSDPEPTWKHLIRVIHDSALIAFFETWAHAGAGTPAMRIDIA